MSDVKLVELDGELVSKAEYCRRLGYNYNSITARMYRHNITFEQAVEDYLKYRGRRKVKDIRLYNRWYRMKDRCENPKNEHYKYYGGKEPNPIRVCERWQDYFNFEDDMLESFLEHVEQFGLKDTTIERNDYDKDYCLENCSWKTKEEQANNKSSNIIVYEGLTFAEVCKKYNLPYQTAWARYKSGWAIEDIINIPYKTLTKTILPTGETLTEASKRLKISKNTLQSRINMGWSMEDVLNTPVGKHKEVFTFPNGETILDVSKRTGISCGTINQRVRLGWSLEKIETTPVQKHK